MWCSHLRAEGFGAAGYAASWSAQVLVQVNDQQALVQVEVTTDCETKEVRFNCTTIDRKHRVAVDSLGRAARQKNVTRLPVLQ